MIGFILCLNTSLGVASEDSTSQADSIVIAEGIETEQQLEILKDMNCQYGQGYLFSPALPIVELEFLLLEWKHGKKFKAL